MNIRFKDESYQKTWDLLQKKLEPAKIRDTQGNTNLFVDWLAKNCADADGVIGGTLDEWFRAAKALHQAGLVDWAVKPTPVPLKEKSYLDSREENRPLTETQAENARISIVEQEEAKRLRGIMDKERANILQEAIDFVKNYRGGRSHSQKAKQVAALKEVFDKGAAAKQHPRDILKALQARVESFDTSTSWGT